MKTTFAESFPVRCVAPAVWMGIAWQPVAAQLYAGHALTISGAPTPALSIRSVSLPPGLFPEAGGRLHGTPRAAGTLPPEVKAVNAGGSDAKSRTVMNPSAESPVYRGSACRSGARRGARHFQ
ncbi:MAG: hypothetical protein LBK22_00165 [Tannerella sp.]|nr:hypothetical protein [Tannerella sp.]